VGRWYGERRRHGPPRVHAEHLRHGKQLLALLLELLVNRADHVGELLVKTARRRGGLSVRLEPGVHLVELHELLNTYHEVGLEIRHKSESKT